MPATDNSLYSLWRGWMLLSQDPQLTSNTEQILFIVYSTGIQNFHSALKSFNLPFLTFFFNDRKMFWFLFIKKKKKVSVCDVIPRLFFGMENLLKLCACVSYMEPFLADRVVGVEVKQHSISCSVDFFRWP